MTHTAVKICCATAQFPEFPTCGPQIKPYEVHGLSKHYHVCLDHKLGHGKCAIQRIPGAFISCNRIQLKT